MNSMRLLAELTSASGQRIGSECRLCGRHIQFGTGFGHHDGTVDMYNLFGPRFRCFYAKTVIKRVRGEGTQA